MNTTDPIVFRPARPEADPALPFTHQSNHYLVCNGLDLVAAYDARYYPSARHVMRDMIARNQTTIDGWADLDHPHAVEGLDFVIWRECRIIGLAHYHYNDWGHSKSVKLFTETDPQGHSNDKGAERAGFGWPTRKQWIQDGSDKIILRPFTVRIEGEERTFQPGEELPWMANARIKDNISDAIRPAITRLVSLAQTLNAAESREVIGKTILEGLRFVLATNPRHQIEGFTLGRSDTAYNPAAVSRAAESLRSVLVKAGVDWSDPELADWVSTSAEMKIAGAFSMMESEA